MSGKSRFLIAREKKELQNPDIQASQNSVRRKGGGCKKEVDKQLGVVEKIKETVEAHTVGDPEWLLLWTSKSVKHVQEELSKWGYKISRELVRQVLLSEGYSLQTNRKVHEGEEHIDRNTQFEHINNAAKSVIAGNQPVISV